MLFCRSLETMALLCEYGERYKNETIVQTVGCRHAVKICSLFTGTKANMRWYTAVLMEAICVM